MKKQFLALLIICICALGISAQNGCSKFYPFKEDTKFQITVFDKKDKASGVINYTVKEVNGNKATFFTEMQDDKGNLITSSEYDVTCKDDGVSIDFNSLMSPGLLEQYKDMDIEMTGTNIYLPNNLSPHQTLPDAEMLMTIKTGPINMNMSVKMVDRKVEGNETITTPAGTFDCTVISFENEFKMGMKRTGTSKQWLAEGVGMVKSEEYNKSGKLIGKSVLTRFEK